MREQFQSSTTNSTPTQTAIIDLLNRIVRMLEREGRHTDEYRGAYLNARFPYGDGKTDRWGRRK